MNKHPVKELWKEIPEKIRYSLFFIIGLFVGLLFLFGCSNQTYVNDNPIEQLIEDVIEQKLNVEIDFTPSSQED